MARPKGSRNKVRRKDTGVLRGERPIRTWKIMYNDLISGKEIKSFVYQGRYYPTLYIRKQQPENTTVTSMELFQNELIDVKVDNGKEYQ